VALVDARQVGTAASWAGAGILPSVPRQGVVDPLDQLRKLSHDLHPLWAAELLASTGIDNGFRTCGGIHVARTLAEKATLIGQQAWWDEHGVAYQALNARQLAALEPALGTLQEGTATNCGWLLQEECQIRNPRHLQALAQACRNRHVSLFENQPVLDWIGNEGRVDGVRTSLGSLEADRFCIATGAWSQGMLSRLGVANGVMPMRGQMVLFHSPRPLIQRIVNEGHRYLVPRDDGHLLAGSCEEEVGYCEQTTDSMIAELRQWAVGLLPGLSQARVVRAWAGLRAWSFDTLPYLGKLPDWSNAYVATGHGRHGLHLSTGTAQVVCDLMMGAVPAIDLVPFRVIRGQGAPIHRRDA
jgi:glycine oxidase